MRKVTEHACEALFGGEDMRLSNTEVMDSVMRLHGHAIAKFEDGKLYINNCGYTSLTTKERLNGVLDYDNNGLSIYQHDWTWYIRNPQGSKMEFPCDEWVDVQDIADKLNND